MEERLNIQQNECPALETSRLFLKEISMEDSDHLFEVFSDEETTHFVSREKHIDKNETINYVEKLIEGIKEGMGFRWSVIIKDENRVIGTVSLHNYSSENKSASIGAVIHSKYWRKGIAFEALSEIIWFGFETVNLVSIDGKCEINNSASERVMKKLGMAFKGILKNDVIIKGEYRDSKLYSLSIEEYKILVKGDIYEDFDWTTNT